MALDPDVGSGVGLEVVVVDDSDDDAGRLVFTIPKEGLLAPWPGSVPGRRLNQQFVSEAKFKGTMVVPLKGAAGRTSTGTLMLDLEIVQ